jgi:hypothetical protein
MVLLMVRFFNWIGLSFLEWCLMLRFFKYKSCIWITDLPEVVKCSNFTQDSGYCTRLSYCSLRLLTSIWKMSLQLANWYIETKALSVISLATPQDTLHPIIDFHHVHITALSSLTTNYDSGNTKNLSEFLKADSSESELIPRSLTINHLNIS